jgi:hypothetical protein
MAEKIVSPGVFTRENDLSFLSQGVGEIGAAVIGPFHKGPAFVPTIVNTQSEFEQIFGTPDGSYYTGYTVQNYLREAGTVTIVRVGHQGGYTQTAPVAIVSVDDASVSQIVGTLFETHNGSGTLAGSTLAASVSASAFEITLVGESGISASINPADGNDLGDVFGVNPRGTKDGYVYNYFEKASADAVASGQTQVSIITLADQAFTTDVQHSSTPWIQSQLVSGERSNLFKLHTIGDGTVYNKEYKVSIFNVKAAGSSNATDYATFSLMIRGYKDTDKRKSVLETYNNLNLDPASPNYIKKVIGDRNLVIDANGKQTENGDYPNRSKFVRVETVAEGSHPIVAGPFGHAKYYNPILVGNIGAHGLGESIIPSVLFATGSDANTSSKSTVFSGIDLETPQVKIDNNNYLSPVPTGATQGGNTAFAFDGTVSVVGGTNAFGFELTGSLSSDMNKRQFTVGFQGGFDGIDPTVSIDLGTSISSGNSQGFNLSTSTAVGSVAYVKAIASVSNPDDFDINLVSVPGIVRRHHSYVFDKAVDMCEAREDCFFIGDVVGAGDSISQAIEQGAAIDSNYVGTYYPWVKTIDSRTNKLISVPPSVLMPGIYASNDAVAAEWFAPAGLNRGGIVGAISVLNRLTHAERDELYEGKINPIAQFPGEGIVAFGQKTLQDKASALDRINVRRLMIKVKKYIASTSRYLVFEQNTSTTRGKFLNTVNPYLEGIQQRQGLYAFRVVMDESNNTPDVIDRNILAGQIFLQPTKTAEFIVLDFNILPTGASFTA